MKNISQDIIDSFLSAYSTDGKGDVVPQSMFSGLTLGVVVDTDDHLQQGRLRIFCPNLNDNPKKIDSIPWSAYVSPFGGSINNSEYYRGVEEGIATSEGSLHYGFWAVPEMGAHVLVGCIDGDPRRRFWIGCLPEHQETNTMHHGRYRWEDEGVINGPLTGSGSPMEPLYSNMLEAFDSQNDRPEFLSRAVEYQVSSNSETVGQAPNSSNTELDQENEQILELSPDEWTHPTLGAHGSDWSGFKKLGAFMSSRTFGWSTPGMHAITMDDRPFNQRVRLRTTNGHQILLDDTNERIYVSTAKGNSYLELDQRGDVHVYAAHNINFNAEDNFNVNADKIRLYARRGIHGYAGYQEVLQDAFSDEANPNGLKLQTPLELEPEDGEIRFHSSADFHIKSEGNIRQLSVKDTYMESNGNYYGKVDISSYYQVEDEINIITNKGDYNLSVAKDLNENVGRNSKRFSEGTTAVASNGNAEFMSFQGIVDIGALTSINIKSSTGAVSFEASGSGTGSGSIQFKTPNSQFEVGDDGVSALTDGAITMQAAESTEFSITSTSPNLSTPVAVNGLPDISNTNTPAGTTGPIAWDGSKTRITIDEAVQIAYNAGWRDKDLPIAVAVMMAESSLRTTVTNKAAPQNETWGDVVGLFQIRCLKHPEKYTGVDRMRDNSNHQLENPNRNAEVGYAIWSQMTPKRQWTVGKWEVFGGKHKGALVTNNLQAATEAVNRFYGNSPSITSMSTPFIMSYRMPFGELIDASSLVTPLMSSGTVGSTTPQNNSAITLDGSNTTIQGKNDIHMRTPVYKNSYNTVISELTTTMATVNQYGMYMNTLITEVTKGLATAGTFSLSLPFQFNLPCLDASLFDLLMPQALLDVVSSLAELNAMLVGLVDEVITLYNIKEQLEGNVDALIALGLPIDFTIDINPSIGICLDGVDGLTSDFSQLGIPQLEVDSFGRLTAQIYSNNSITTGYRGNLLGN